MKATFRIAADLAVEVESSPRLGCVHLRLVDPDAGPGNTLVPPSEVPLSKPEARALGSALTGAAAEL